MIQNKLTSIVNRPLAIIFENAKVKKNHKIKQSFSRTATSHLHNYNHYCPSTNYLPSAKNYRPNFESQIRRNTESTITTEKSNCIFHFTSLSEMTLRSIYPHLVNRKQSVIWHRETQNDVLLKYWLHRNQSYLMAKPGRCRWGPSFAAWEEEPSLAFWHPS